MAIFMGHCTQVKTIDQKRSFSGFTFDEVELVVICDWNKQEIHGGNISFPQFGNYVGSKPPCVYDEF